MEGNRMKMSIPVIMQFSVLRPVSLTFSQVFHGHQMVDLNILAEEENQLETTENILKYHPRQGVSMEELGCL